MCRTISEELNFWWFIDSKSTVQTDLDVCAGVTGGVVNDKTREVLQARLSALRIHDVMYSLLYNMLVFLRDTNLLTEEKFHNFNFKAEDVHPLLQILGATARWDMNMIEDVTGPLNTTLRAHEILKDYTNPLFLFRSLGTVVTDTSGRVVNWQLPESGYDCAYVLRRLTHVATCPDLQTISNLYFKTSGEERFNFPTFVFGVSCGAKVRNAGNAKTNQVVREVASSIQLVYQSVLNIVRNHTGFPEGKWHPIYGPHYLPDPEFDDPMSDSDESARLAALLV